MLEVSGIAEARVDVVAGKMTVVHEAPASTITEVVSRLGYHAAAEGEVPQAPPATFLATHAQKIMAVVSGVFLLEGWLLSLALGEHYWLVVGYYMLAAAVGGYQTFQKGLVALKNLRFDMNALMTIGVTGAILLGAFSEAGAIAFLYAVSHWLESATMGRTRRAIGELVDMRPTEAMVLREGGEAAVPVAEVVPGSLVRVRPGGRVPVDGVIEEGTTTLDQGPITGESMPVARTVGEAVFAGAINGPGAITVRVTKRAEDTTLARIIHLVEEAQAARAPSQAFIDRFAAVYTPIVLVAALLVATVPPAFFDVELVDWIYRGLALLVLACPCALVVSTPVALATAIGGAARRGLLIKGGLPIEAAASARFVAFDKTGTLTEGRPEVRQVTPLGAHSPEAVLAAAAAVEVASEHPLAAAILRHAEKSAVPYEAAYDFQAAVGQGASATVEAVRLHVGSLRYFKGLGVDVSEAEKLVDRVQGDGATAVLVGDDAGVHGVIAVADALRPAARRVVLALNALGLEPVAMLTGDHTQAARAVGKLAGVDEIKAELLPEDKVGALKQLMAKHGPAIMVGDGVNDAPALATAHVSVAMGRGTDVAIETADVAILNDDLTRLPYMIRLSRETMGIIRQNIAFSIGIKVVAVLAIFPGWLTLWLAVIADMGATILVTLNGLRLLAVKPDDR